MRVYIIGNDGITLCREAPTALNDGEIAVASNEALHAAPLSGKRLLLSPWLIPVRPLGAIGTFSRHADAGANIAGCRRIPVLE